MSTIDKIMKCAYEYGGARARGYETSDPADSRLVCAERAELQALLTAAIAEARLEGAEAMRESAARAVAGVVIPGWIEDASFRIRALPLPAGNRQVVKLKEGAIEEAIYGYARWDGDFWAVEDADWVPMHRALEAAVLAANGLGVRRG